MGKPKVSAGSGKISTPSKSAKRGTARAKQLSQEFVVDSDGDDDNHDPAIATDHSQLHKSRSSIHTAEQQTPAKRVPTGKITNQNVNSHVRRAVNEKEQAADQNHDEDGTESENEEANQIAKMVGNREETVKAIGAVDQSKAPIQRLPTDPSGVNGVRITTKASNTLESESDTEGDTDEDELESFKPPSKRVKITDSARVEESLDEQDENSDGQEKSVDASEQSADDVAGASEEHDARIQEHAVEEAADDEGHPKAEATKLQAQKRNNQPAMPLKRADCLRPSLKPIAAKPFKPPAGYTPQDLPTRHPASSIIPTPFEGKQIWHITAPSDLSLASLTSITLDSIRSGIPILTYRGIDYALTEDASPSSQNESLLLSSPDGYTKISHPVSKTLHLRPHLTLPELSARRRQQQQHSTSTTASRAVGNFVPAPVRHIQSQPRGLLMRYKPPGSKVDKPSRVGLDSDSTDDAGDGGTASNAALQFPSALSVHNGAKRQAIAASRSDRVVGEDAKEDQIRRVKRKEKRGDRVGLGKESPVMQIERDMNVKKKDKKKNITEER